MNENEILDHIDKQIFTARELASKNPDLYQR